MFIDQRSSGAEASGGGREKPSTVVSAYVGENGVQQVLSLFGDPVWELWPYCQQSNLMPSQKRICWTRIPNGFRDTCKTALYRYWQEGQPGFARPGARTVVQRATQLSVFCQYLAGLGIRSLRDVQGIHIANFIHRRKTVDGVSASTLAVGLTSIETLYRFGAGLAGGLQHHPWPDSSAADMAGWTGRLARKAGKTPLIPLRVLQTLFTHAERLLGQSDGLLDERDAGRRSVSNDPEVMLLRDACFFLIGVLTGMRCEEIVGIEVSAGRVEVKDGTTFHWVRSIEHKTGKGPVEYLMPSLCLRVLQVMERWSAPLRNVLDEGLSARQADATSTAQLIEAHREAEARADSRRLFLGSRNRPDTVRAVSGLHWNKRMLMFAQSAGVDWRLSPHQLRRTYAWTFARHRLGSLLFLKEQFKHSSMEMTQLYAANPQQDDDLYDDLLSEINAHKVELVEGWLHEDTRLSGGAGRKIIAMRAHDYPNRRALIEETADWLSIRSTGHSWCLAQDDGCGGAGLYERTQCGSCADAVIDSRFTATWQSIHAHQRELLSDAKELGAGAIQRVRRDLHRSREVLTDLGVSLIEETYEN